MIIKIPKMLLYFHQQLDRVSTRARKEEDVRQNILGHVDLGLPKDPVSLKALVEAVREFHRIVYKTVMMLYAVLTFHLLQIFTIVQMEIQYLLHKYVMESFNAIVDVMKWTVNVKQMGTWSYSYHPT